MHRGGLPTPRLRHSREGGNPAAHIRRALIGIPEFDTENALQQSARQVPVRCGRLHYCGRVPTVALSLDTHSVDIHHVDFDVPVSVGGKHNFASVRRPRRVEVQIGVVGEAGDV